MDASGQDSLSGNVLELFHNEMKPVDNHLQAEHVEEVVVEEEDTRKDLEILLSRVKSAASSLHYLQSKARIMAVSSLTLEDGTEEACSCKMLESIQIITDVLESLLRRVTAAESETCFQKERVSISEEELRRKTIQIENLSLRLEDMKLIIHGNKTVLDETTEMIKKLVEDSIRDKEKALENEEELRHVKIECESLRNYVNTSTNVIETLLSSERQFQTIEARLVAKSTQLEGEKAQKEVEVQKLMEENMKLTSLLDKKEAQLLALNEQCKIMALNASNL